MSNQRPEFKEFPKIGRLSRNCVITEKIDGTNALVCITEDGGFFTGSRTRWITPTEDNYGFSAWAHGFKSELMRLGPGFHFGEWWGNGCQRGYGLPKGEKRWSLFNTIRWCLHDSEPQRIITSDPRIEKYQERLPACCHLVPELYRGPFTTDACNAAIWKLEKDGSVAAPGFMKPEGIICYHLAGGVSFKKTIEKDEAPKSNA